MKMFKRYIPVKLLKPIYKFTNSGVINISLKNENEKITYLAFKNSQNWQWLIISLWLLPNKTSAGIATEL